MSGIVNGVTDMFGMGGGGDDAAAASRDAANIQAQYQREALEYLKEREALPQQYREAALTETANIAGLGDDPEAQQRAIDRAQRSPLYEAIMGTLPAGEEAIMRQAGATGGLRSGNVQDALATNAQQLQQQALLQSYNQQMQAIGGLAGLPSLAPTIAQQQGGIGRTLAQGRVAEAQAQQSGQQQGIGNFMGLANLGMSAYQAFSDRRLKMNVEKIGERKGFNWYKWDWNSTAKQFGLTGSAEGVMADEVEKTNPEKVRFIQGFKTVDYEGLL